MPLLNGTGVRFQLEKEHVMERHTNSTCPVPVTTVDSHDIPQVGQLYIGKIPLYPSKMEGDTNNTRPDPVTMLDSHVTPQEGQLYVENIPFGSSKVPEDMRKNRRNILKESLICTQCKKEFSVLSNLIRHQKWHEIYSHNVIPLENASIKKHVCDLCKKSYGTKFNLSRHMKTSHNIQIQSPKVTTPNSQTYKCDRCQKCFCRNYSLRKHCKMIHKITVPPKLIQNLKCSQCSSTFTSKPSFIDHLSKIHEFSINTEIIEFHNMYDFKKWKIDIERKTASKYVINQKYKTKSNYISTSYVCHRNGNFKSSSSGKRHLKIGGSNKIDFFCPASMFVQTKACKESKEIKVKFTSSHLGHKCEVRTLGLSKVEKDQIAGQLLSGVSMQNVLVSISEQASPMTRLAATNMQDLRNICKEYGINSKVQEKSPISEQLCRNKLKKKYQQEARNAVLGFVAKLEEFTSEKQCAEICRTISLLTSKCEALGTKKNTALFPIGQTTAANKNIELQRMFPKKKKSEN